MLFTVPPTTVRAPAAVSVHERGENHIKYTVKIAVKEDG